MTRSIHHTRARLRHALRERYADAEIQRERAAGIRAKLEHKRRIKNAVREYRRVWSGELPAPQTASAIPVLVRDDSPFIHHVASPEDIRAILGGMPAGSLDGLAAVICELGRELQRDIALNQEGEEYTPDPFTGRLGETLFPEIFMGPAVATYHPASSTIRLFALVYDPAHALAEPLLPYLKLKMLSSLVHELAHHHDFMRRVARGRWQADDRTQLERYAEQQGYALVQRLVLPYLTGAYPDEVARLEQWIRHHGGAHITLAMLVGAPLDTRAGILVSDLFNVAEAFSYLVEGYLKREDLTTLRCEFARDVHYGGRYDLALEALETVLAEEPENLTTLTLKADIFEHQERHDDALALATRVVTNDPRSRDAWEVLVDVYRALRDWEALAGAATRALALTEPDGRLQRYLLAWRARARLELADYAGLRDDLELLLRERLLPTRRYRSGWCMMAVGLRAIMLLRQGLYRQALEAANTGLAELTGSVWEDELLAVRAEAARELGDSDQTQQLNEVTLERLRRLGYEEWVEQLLARYPDIRAPEPRRTRRGARAGPSRRP